MVPENDILQELRENAPGLVNVGRAMPYKVPAGYFNDLAELVLMRIKTMEASTAEEELEMLSPLLGGIKKETPFKVPAGYFDNLAANAIKTEAPANKKETPVRRISFPTRVLKYAAAAVVAGLIGVTVWLGMDRSAVKNKAVFAQKDSITLKGLNNISDTEIENFLDGDVAVINNNYEFSNPSNDIKDEDIRLMLTDISDKELEHFLN